MSSAVLGAAADAPLLGPSAWPGAAAEEAPLLLPLPSTPPPPPPQQLPRGEAPPRAGQRRPWPALRKQGYH